MREETEAKDIKWANEEIKKEWNLLNDKRYEREVDDLTTGVLLGLKKALNILNQLDEPEVLSEEWIDEHTFYNGNVSEGGFIFVAYLKDKLVPKQEEVNQAYKDGYEKGKQHTFYKGYLEGLADKEKEPEKVEDDPVHRPQHYMQGHIETIDKIKLLLTPEEYLGYLKGNVIKYDRAPFKGNMEQDYDKQKVYYDWALEQMEEMQDEE